MIPRGIKPKALREVLAAAEDAGATVSLTRGNHVRVETPEGPYFTGSTASDGRVIRHLRSDLRRRGIDIP